MVRTLAQQAVLASMRDCGAVVGTHDEVNGLVAFDGRDSFGPVSGWITSAGAITWGMVLEPARVHAATYRYRTPRAPGMLPFVRLTR